MNMPRHANLPHHIYVNVDNRFLGPNVPPGTTRGIWHAVFCREYQVLMAHVMLESGAHWSGLPLHALSTKNEFSHSFEELMPWASMGEEIDITHLKYMEGLESKMFQPFESPGRHTGIMIDWKDGYSRYPAEHKPLNLLELECGQFALLPNNYITYNDKHFTEPERFGDLKHYRRGETVYWEK